MLNSVRLLLTGLFIPALCSAGGFSFQSLNYPGASTTNLFDINDTGQIVGQNEGPGFSFGPGFVLTDLARDANGVFTYPSAIGNSGFKIDNNGDVSGIYQLADASVGGFVRSAGGMFSSVFSAPHLDGSAISPDGQPAFSGDNDLYLYNGSTYVAVAIPGAGSYANAANISGVDDAGDVVGYYFPSTTSFYRTAGGVYQTIYYPGSVYTEVLGMNNSGKAVGFWYDGTRDHGFIWDTSGAISTLDYPGAANTFVSGINSSGELVGFYDVTVPGQIDGRSGFAATPLPEPSTGLMTSAVVLIGILAIRGRSSSRLV